MGARLEYLFGEIPANTKHSLESIDKLVEEYKQASGDNKAKLLVTIIKSFHGYLMKYVQLLTRNTSESQYYRKDTIKFFALFLAGEQKKANNYKKIHNSLKYLCLGLEPEEVYNELAILFISLLNTHTPRENVSFARYITLYMRWAIKDWLIKLAKEKRIVIIPQADIEMEEEMSEEDPNLLVDLPQMDLAWIINPDNKLFEVLTSYERFLLQQNFKEGLGVRIIGERLGRTKNTINRHIRHALKQLRKAYLKGGC